jgi:hypothetical protein
MVGTPSSQSMLGYVTGRHLGVSFEVYDTRDVITTAAPIHLHRCAHGWYNRRNGGDLPTVILAKAIFR